MCIVYDYYKVTSSPEDWIYAHLNLPLRSLTMKTKQRLNDDDDDDDIVMIDFYVADERW
jgi:hypothetical protein